MQSLHPGGQKPILLGLLNFLFHFLLLDLAQTGDVGLVDISRVRRDELREQFGVFVVHHDGLGVATGTQDARFGLVGVRVAGGRGAQVNGVVACVGVADEGHWKVVLKGISALIQKKPSILR